MNNKYNENTEINAYKYWGNNCPSGTDLLLVQIYLKHYYLQSKLSSNLNLTLFISYTLLILNELFSGYIRNNMSSIWKITFIKQIEE